MKQFLVLLLSLFFLESYSQPVPFSGKIIDSENAAPLIGANVQISKSQLLPTITGEDGSFQFTNAPAGKFEIVVSYVGYVTVTKMVDASVSPLIIEMDTEYSKLSEVTVAGKAILAEIHGDTTAYNADAFKTNPDADAEDLIKKMPGIIVENGTVQAQGENVKKVYVDGKPFFDQDPSLALKSLPADVIQTIEVFDEKSEQSQFTGFDDGETSKVMNIVTRKGMKNGQFGKMYAGYGFEDKYLVGGNVSLFDADRRISIIAQSNNVNQQNFSDEDLLGVIGNSGRRGGGFKGGGGGGRGGGGPKGGGGRGGQGASAQDFMVGTQSGITNSIALGLNYSDKWGEKVNVSGSYFFNMSDNNTLQDIHQDYFTEIDSLSQVYNEDNDAESDNNNHRLHLRFEYNINEMDRLIIQPRLSYQGNTSISSILGSSWLGDSLLNTAESDYVDDRQGYNFSNRMTYMHRFDKVGRTLSASLNNSLANSAYESSQQSSTYDMSTLDVSDSLDQFSDSENATKSVSGRLAYTEGIGDKSMLMFNLLFSYTYNDNDKQVFNLYESDSSPDSLLSNIYESTYAQQQVGAAYMRRWDRNNLMIKMDYEYATLTSDQVFPSTGGIDRVYHSFLPMVRLKMNLSKTKNINFFYRTNTNSPSVTQLQNTIDNSNTLQLSSGNPDLDPTYSHSLMLRYNTTNLEKATLFFIMASMGYTDNYIGTNTWYATEDTMINNSVLLVEGGQFSQPINLDHSWNAKLFTTYGFPVTAIRSNINLNANYTYQYTPGMYNDELSFSNNHIIGGGLTLASNVSENVDFTLSSNTKYNTTTSSYNEASSNSYITQNTELSLTLIFPTGIVFRSAVASQYYYWNDSQESESFVMWNMELGKKFLKNQQAEIKLAVYDVLNQNSNYSRSVTDIYVEDVQSNVLQRYLMLSFNYRLRNFRL